MHCAYYISRRVGNANMYYVATVLLVLYSRASLATRRHYSPAFQNVPECKSCVGFSAAEQKLTQNRVDPVLRFTKIQTQSLQSQEKNTL